MENRTMKKIYYRIEFTLNSAMSVGSGKNSHSDGDIIRDAQGFPFIPGSSLAGIYRSFLGEETAGKYFGPLKLNEKKLQEKESKVLVYDAKLKEKGGFCRTSIRDCVMLDEWKTGVDGSKFDFEIVEPGAVFVTYLEQNCGEADEDVGKTLSAAWLNGMFSIGRKTMRGMGSIKDAEVRRREFDFAEGKSLEQWLDFDMYGEKDWKDSPAEKTEMTKSADNIRVELHLKQRGGISVRRYTTKVKTGNIQPDSEQITYQTKTEGEELPVIPGTSWAGAFRHHMNRLLPGSPGEYFGYCDNEKKEKKKSAVRFSESLIEGASAKLITRNAIDRFTGGVVTGALFSEKMWYGGNTTLVVEFPSNVNSEFKQAMAASINDLHMGLLSVGGSTSVGRGIFEIESMTVNGEQVTTAGREIMYDEILGRFEGRCKNV